MCDNGSTINVCPLRVATRLGITKEEMAESPITVRAYDNSKREVLGTVTLEIQIGPITFPIQFQVIDISASFNLLLGRPWLHETGAMASTLHQKLKIPYLMRVKD